MSIIALLAAALACIASCTASPSAPVAVTARRLQGAPEEPRLRRVNITSPLQMLNITTCEDCTGRGVDQDSVFCRQGTASVTVFNTSDVTKVAAEGTATAYCWDGTFGTLLSVTGDKQWAYTQPVVTWKVECELGFLLYNQCIISALVAIILMAFGSVVFLVATTALCICFGCCNCCFVKRKFAESEDDKICCILSPCDRGSSEARELMTNPMAAREKERKELESEGGLI